MSGALAFSVVLFAFSAAAESNFTQRLAKRPVPPTGPVVEGFPVVHPSQVGMDIRALQKMSEYAFDSRLPHKTDALVVIKDGRLVWEQYGNGYSRAQRHMLWSFSKSLVNAILGVAETRGHVHRDSFVYQYYPELNHPVGRTLKLRHLMNMTSGLEYFEEHPTDIILTVSLSITLSMVIAIWPNTLFESRFGVGPVKSSITAAVIAIWPWAF